VALQGQVSGHVFSWWHSSQRAHDEYDDVASAISSTTLRRSGPVVFASALNRINFISAFGVVPKWIIRLTLSYQSILTLDQIRFRFRTTKTRADHRRVGGLQIGLHAH
jgi:hypothetical protein